MTTAPASIAIGYAALSDATTDGYNTAVGYEALLHETSTYNTAVGYHALRTSTSGNNNDAFGHKALYSLTSAGYNACFGNHCGWNITTANHNVGMGRYVFGSSDGTPMTGGDNTAVGNYAMQKNQSGQRNVAYGYSASFANTTGGYNSFVGYQAGLANTTASHNTAVGCNALDDCTTGGSNCAMGSGALNDVTDGTYNIGIGYRSGGYSVAMTTGDKNILIGSDSYTSVADGQSQIVIGTYQMQGKGNSTGFISPGDGDMYQGNNGTHWTTTSDRRIKKNIVDNTTGLDKINQITVRNFEYRTEDEIIADSPELSDVSGSAVVHKEGIQLGVIAQEIEPILPDVVKTESTGVKSVDPENITWYMLNAIKELSAKVEELQAKLG